MLLQTHDQETEEIGLFVTILFKTRRKPLPKKNGWFQPVLFCMN
jgi:hypothetical protein